MMEPELVFHATLDIEDDEVSIEHWDFENTKKPSMPTRYPNKTQVENLFSDDELLRRVKMIYHEIDGMNSSIRITGISSRILANPNMWNSSRRFPMKSVIN